MQPAARPPGAAALHRACSALLSSAGAASFITHLRDHLPTAANQSSTRPHPESTPAHSPAAAPVLVMAALSMDSAWNAARGSQPRSALQKSRAASVAALRRPAAVGRRRYAAVAAQANELNKW